MQVVDVKGDFALWRTRCRALLEEGIPPERLLWRSPDDPEQSTLFMLLEDVGADTLAPIAEPHVPRAFVSSSKLVIHHADPERWPLLYRVLWRITHGEPGLMDVRVDPDIMRMARMEAEVRRESHKAKAFIRFRRVLEPDGGEHFIAWHNLEHPVVPHIAPFLADRFASMRWSLLTPRGSVSWRDGELHYGPACSREEAPASDELEDLWKTYYRAIFNPARVKISAMMAEMPQKHWPTMPETEVIRSLLREAPARVREMVAHSPAGDASSLLPPEHERTLEHLRAALPHCDACDLCARVRGPVMGEGMDTARVVLVGEQPGATEDKMGRPFVGPAGELLDALLMEAGIAREACYITNSVKAFQFELRHGRRTNKNPTFAQVNVCKPWLHAELAAIEGDPVVLALGAIAAFSLLGRRVHMERERGLYRTAFASRTIITYHPSALLRTPEGDLRERKRRALLDALVQARDLAALSD